jgi:hypothetical protein
MIYLSAIIYTSMIPNIQNSSNKIKGSSLSLPAYGRAGQGQHSLAAHFVKQNTKNCGGGKARAGQEEKGYGENEFPPRPSEKVFCSAAQSAAIRNRIPDFRQKKFGF